MLRQLLILVLVHCRKNTWLNKLNLVTRGWICPYEYQTIFRLINESNIPEPLMGATRTALTLFVVCSKSEEINTSPSWRSRVFLENQLFTWGWSVIVNRRPACRQGTFEKNREWKSAGIQFSNNMSTECNSIVSTARHIYPMRLCYYLFW